ncbi:MAG: Bax inhibitor-1 family protein [Gammaproteobacteria bacterium]|nr:Bax inhibitor-1 family protein [Gammaproteobacteria bacterium]
MHIPDTNSSSVSRTSHISSNKVIRNTFALLSLFLFVGMLVANLSLSLTLPYFVIICCLVTYPVMLFLISKFQNSSNCIWLVFTFSIIAAFTIGPIFNTFLAWNIASQLMVNILFSVGLIFMCLSLYAQVSLTPFKFYGSYGVIMTVVAFFSGPLALISDKSALSLILSVIIILLITGLTLYKISNFIDAGETNPRHIITRLFASVFRTKVL